MSIILKSFCYFILQITLLLSILILLRGHNYPGGGFIGALMATSGIGFYIMTYKALPTFLKKTPVLMINIGLFILIGIILLPTLIAHPMLSGLWKTFTFFSYKLALGTPIFFDIGIYCIVLGSLSLIISVLEESRDD